ncbi:MAG: hypothetical protein ACRCSS_11735 [Shewanella sp.]
MAIASEGNVPVPTKASRSSMTGLTQFIPTPCGNFAGEGELLTQLCKLLIPKDLRQSCL